MSTLRLHVSEDRCAKEDLGVEASGDDYTGDTLPLPSGVVMLEILLPCKPPTGESSDWTLWPCVMFVHVGVHLGDILQHILLCVPLKFWRYQLDLGKMRPGWSLYGEVYVNFT